jgi:hypothetical protein
MSVPTTTNYGLKMPDGSEKVKPDDFNFNAQKIDTELYRLDSNVSSFLNIKKVVFSCIDTSSRKIRGIIVKCGLTNKYFVSDASGAITVPYNLTEISATSDTITVITPFDSTVNVSSVAVDLTNNTTQNVPITVTALATTAFSFATSTIGCFTSLTSSITAWICGAGGSGGIVSGYAEDYYIKSASGGAGGYTAMSTIPIANLIGKVLQITVGSGGTGVAFYNNGSNAWAATSGNAGGATSIKDLVMNTTVLNANGGSGGIAVRCSTTNTTYGTNGAAGGSGAGAAYAASTATMATGVGGTNGGNGGAVSGYAGGVGQGTNTYMFGETSNTLCSGAGGSAVQVNWTYSTSAGGAGGGTSAVSNNGNTSISSAAATVNGAGSGAAANTCNYNGYSVASGKGGDGICKIRRTAA